jgi:hypothetical protein
MIEITIQVGSDESHGCIMMEAKQHGEADAMQIRTAKELMEVIRTYLDLAASSSKTGAMIEADRMSDIAKAIAKKFKLSE